VALAHVRPSFTERFTPVQGDFRVELDGEEHEGEPGRTDEVRPGVTHDFWNAGRTEAHIVVEVETSGPVSRP
jgi:quercetin dioxygenase-like cupin family protein